MKDSKTLTKEKKLYIEIIRIIAIYFVIFNHTNQRGFTHFTLMEQGSFKYWICMFFSVFSKVSVPLFFMISGMFLLDKEESIKEIWIKRISKYIIILLVFSLINYFIIIKFNLNTFSIKDFLIKLYSTGVIIPYWFLYSYIAFLIGLPFLRKMVKSLDDKDYIYLLIIYLLFNGLIYMLQYRLSDGSIRIHDKIIPSYLTNTVFFYPLIGYYLGNRLKTVTKKICLITGALFFLSMILTLYITNYIIKLTGDLSESTIGTFYSSTIPLQVIFVFCIIKKLFEDKKLPKVLDLLIISVGSCTFGIYLIEQALRESLYFIYDKMCLYINDFAAILIYILFIMIIGYVIIFILKKIPFVNRYI